MNHGWTSRLPGRSGVAAGLLVSLILLAGCAGFNDLDRPVQSQPYGYQPVQPGFSRPLPARQPDDAAPQGSLWHENAPMMHLFSDQKARMVGDVVTIKIAESSQATNKASTATDRSSSLSAKVDGFFNLEEQFPATRSFPNPFSRIAGGVESEFEGAGTTRRSGDLDAYITALVTQVLPNGNLVVTGSREVLINNENQVIQLTGVVRPRDINADNQVLSIYIADARISYSGNGVIDNRQKPGWLTNIVMQVWPF